MASIYAIETANANGNGGNGSKPEVVHGSSLAHMKLNATERACIVAQALCGEKELRLSRQQLTRLLSVNQAYVSFALSLSPDKRKAIANGKDAGLSFSVLKRHGLLRHDAQLRLSVG